jgi:UDP-N-acetylmuramoyl-tripeptide--D-alanyl-D-alanine ligase
METQRKNVLSWGDRSPITSPLPGKHNFENLAAALAIGLHFGVPYERIGKALETYKPTNNRSQILDLHNGITVWLDAYNANPSSMAAALESAAAFAGDRPLVCFLGDMLELGDFSESAHFELCKMLESYSPHMVFLVGSCFYRNRDIFPSFRFLESISDLNPTFLHTIPAHAVVLFKGSRGLRMERIAQILQEAE